MASVSKYVANGTFIGQQFEVKAKKFVWVKVGQGAVVKLSDHEVEIAGKISIMGYSGDLNIHLQLADQDTASLKGPCILQLNSHLDENARYEATSDTLTVFATLSDKEQNITILQCNNGEQTECKLFGHVNQTVHLDPL